MMELPYAVTYVCEWCRYVWDSTQPLSFWKEKGCPKCGRTVFIAIRKENKTMSEVRLFTVSLNREQEKAIDESIKNLVKTILEVIWKLDLPSKDMERMVFTEVTLMVISHLASWVSELVSEADLEMARMLGLEPSS